MFICRVAAAAIYKPACVFETALSWSRENSVALTSVLPASSHFLQLGLIHRQTSFNPLNAELNPICYLLALLGSHHFLHVSRIRVKLITFRLLMSYTYGAPILDVSRSHTTTQHSR